MIQTLTTAVRPPRRDGGAARPRAAARLGLAVVAAVLVLSSGAAAADRTDPAKLGVAAFGIDAALGDLVRTLETDPATDWASVDLTAARRHLIDRALVVTAAAVVTREIPGGFAADLSGEGRVLAAIRRLVPAQAAAIDGRRGWIVGATLLPRGYRLTASARRPAETVRLRALGAVGLMVIGDHHAAALRALATGSAGSPGVVARPRPSHAPSPAR